jgi:hypothetical protein
VILEKGCFYVQCGIKDTFEILQNKISKKSEAKCLLYIKNEEKVGFETKYIKYSLRDDYTVSEDERIKKKWDDEIVFCAVDKNHLFKLKIMLLNTFGYILDFFTMDVVCGKTFESLKNEIRPYFRIDFGFSRDDQQPVDLKEELGLLFVNEKKIFIVHSPCVIALVKLVGFPEEERKRIKSCFEYIHYEDEYLGDHPEETVDMHAVDDDTIYDFKLSFCEKYSIKEENIYLFYEYERIDTNEIQSKTLKEMNMCPCRYKFDKVSIDCVWKEKEKL